MLQSASLFGQTEKKGSHEVVKSSSVVEAREGRRAEIGPGPPEGR